MSKVRFQMFLDQRQKSRLEEIQANLKIPIAEQIRRAIDKFLAEMKEDGEQEDETTKKLLSVCGICSGGPADLADKHDEYLYGKTPK